MAHADGQLKRQIGLFHAVMLGLGSILGTGVFVSIGIAAGIAGPAVLIAIVLAGLLALCNGLSSAQLAAAHPVAGGTYEYGYKYLNDKLGFIAGWMFLCAKSASAATAALGVAHYLLWQFVVTTAMFESMGFQNIIYLEVAIALLCIVAVLVAVLCGIRRSAWLNTVLVTITLLGLVIAFGSVFRHFPITKMSVTQATYTWSNSQDGVALFAATALVFVAFTGYGRIATLGEEVRNPKRVIPTAILITLVVSAVLYLGVGLTVVLAMERHQTLLVTGSLDHALYALGSSRWVLMIVSIAAITAMLGVLLNLILGLSRVVLAMGRRGDMPRVFARVNASGTTPVPAVLLVGGIIALLTLVGDIKATWSFAAFTVLIYYSITDLACLRLPKEDRLYPRVFAWAGLVGCFFLAWWVEPIYWMIGLATIVAGLFWQNAAQRFFKKPPDPRDICAQCGYDLRASQGKCPECGHRIPSEGAVESEPEAPAR